MDLMEITEKERLSREDAAAKLELEIEDDERELEIELKW